MALWVKCAADYLLSISMGPRPGPLQDVLPSSQTSEGSAVSAGPEPISLREALSAPDLWPLAYYYYYYYYYYYCHYHYYYYYYCCCC